MTSLAITLSFITLSTLAALPRESAEERKTPSFDYERSVRDHLQHKLAAPDAATVKLLREPRWGQFVGFKMPWSDPDAGWITCYSINAKNPDGSYTGPQTVLFILTSDGLVRSTYYEKNYRQPAGNRVTRECSEH